MIYPEREKLKHVYLGGNKSAFLWAKYTFAWSARK